MKEERLKILAMVEQGKISVDEAAKLLESIRDTYSFDDYAESDFNDKVKSFSKNAESFAKEVGGKMSSFAKDMEPKVKKATQVVVAKTANIVEELSKALNECLNNMDTDRDEEQDYHKEGCCCGCGEQHHEHEHTHHEDKQEQEQESENREN